MKKTNYEIINHGYDHSQYFQGCGTYGSSFDHVVTGCGYNAKEAYNDALDQLAQRHSDFNGYLNIPTKPRGINAKDKVPAKIAREEMSEIWFYVSIRYNL